MADAVLSARAGTEVILQLWQPKILRVIAQGIDTPLRVLSVRRKAGFLFH